MVFQILFLIFTLNICVVFSNIVCTPQPGSDPLKPIGKGKGIFPGRVVWNHDPSSTSWTGDNTTFWWNYIDQDKVAKMLRSNILSLTGRDTVRDSWDSIFTYYNTRHFQEVSSYKPGEKIAIKINLNNEHGYDEGYNGNSLSPQFLKSLLRQLVSFGVPQEDIYVYDGARFIPRNYWDEPWGIGKEFGNVNLYDNAGGAEYVKKISADFTNRLYFSDKKVVDCNDTVLPKILSDARYFIVVANFRGHDIGGMTMVAKNFFGTFYAPHTLCDFGIYNAGHWCPKNVHEYINVKKREMGTYNPLVDLLGHKELAEGKGLVFFSDALYSGIAEHEGNVPIRFKSLGNWWSSSLFSSMDPVALDSVAFDFLRNEPNQPYPKVGCTDNYLHEAASIPNCPSLVNYDPNNNGGLKQSLGVHEHWNNEFDRKYSRNLGKNEGIELIQIKH